MPIGPVNDLANGLLKSNVDGQIAVMEDQLSAQFQARPKVQSASSAVQQIRHAGRILRLAPTHDRIVRERLVDGA